MTAPVIPFNRPAVVGDEMRHVGAALASGHLSGDGAFTKRCHALLEEIVGQGRPTRALLTTSCTHALELAALLLDLAPGDEVILPSFTFVSTANAFALRGAVPVFADIRPDTLCIDAAQVAELVTPRTRAVVPVHYAGVPCDMAALDALARKHGLTVIEDNAHGFLGSLGERALGSFGELSTLSFHETKNITCGEGGALLINDPALVERAEILREKAPTAASSSAVRSTSTPGSISARATCRRSCWRHSCSASSRRGSGCRPSAAGSGSATAPVSPTGRGSPASRCRTFRRAVRSPSTCSTCCCPRSPRARR
jgi:dTDP-4-amino-4,6-dideoxygalactose transaminase